ncbi:hypothetical protein ACIGCM_15010 [Pseudomonas sp. NPDC078700]|uniref:hypothetical protein n=1 Tax=Pseudomonas sp. NPDC078700 TaxID=3364424 RepID=UPI0037CA0EEB
MAVLKVSPDELSCLLSKLSGVLDFNKDLPLNVFVDGDFLFWFFERPILSFFDVICGLITVSISSFKSDVFIKFSGGELLVDSCFSVNGSDVENDLIWIGKRSEDFFGGAVGYPIILFNRTHDWIAFESAHEEFGVIAVRESALQEVFVEYLDSNLISSGEITALASGTSAESKIARAFISSFIS